MTLKERFKSKLSPKDLISGCVEWADGRMPDGYGYIKVGGKLLRPHRVAWELANGPIPDGIKVLHRCDNRPCCNLDHLFLGTNQDNVDDRNSKGRQARGGGHGMSKLSDLDVAKIRQRLKDGGSQRAIAKDFGVTQQAVHNIKKRKTWNHVD